MPCGFQGGVPHGDLSSWGFFVANTEGKDGAEAEKVTRSALHDAPEATTARNRTAFRPQMQSGSHNIAAEQYNSSETVSKKNFPLI